MDIGAYRNQRKLLEFMCTENAQVLLFSLFASSDGGAMIKLPVACYKSGTGSERLPESLAFSEFLVEACEDAFEYDSSAVVFDTVCVLVVPCCCIRCDSALLLLWHACTS